jgi:hypothetical protein
LAVVGVEGLDVVMGIAEDDDIRAKPDADGFGGEEKLELVEGVAVATRPTVVVPAIVLGGAEAIEAGIAMGEVAAGTGDSKEPCILSMLKNPHK